VSLIERQVAILRERNRPIRRPMNDPVQAERNNDELSAKLTPLTLSLGAPYSHVGLDIEL